MKEISVLQYKEYRPYLLDILKKEKGGFSLRGLARLAGMSPSHLSRALKGTKKLSAASAHRLSIALNQSPEESDHLLNLIELEQTGNAIQRNRIMSRLNRNSKSSSTVSLDVFRIIADWYNFALVALTNTKSFRTDSFWIARRLGIQPYEAKAALERLIEVGLLKRSGRSVQAVNDADISTTDDLASAAIRENHSQHLSMAQRALHDVPIELREFNNLTIAMNSEDAPKAKKLIREFIDKFNREMKSRPSDEIFQLNLQFYRLSKPERNK